MDAARVNGRLNRILLGVCGECRGGVSGLDLVVWGAALCRPRERLAATASVRQAAVSGGISVEGLRAALMSSPTGLERHSEGLRKLASVLLKVHGEFFRIQLRIRSYCVWARVCLVCAYNEVNAKCCLFTLGEGRLSGTAVRALFMGLLERCPRIRRTLSADLAFGLCSNSAIVAKRAAGVVLGVALASPAWVDGVYHALLEPLQRANSLNVEAVPTLAESAGVLIRGRRQLATSLLVSIRKQLLFGSTADRCLGAQVAGALIPRLPPTDSDDALEMLLRAAPGHETDPVFALKLLEVLASIASASVKIDPTRVKTLLPFISEAVEKGRDGTVSVRVDVLSSKYVQENSRRVAVAASVTLALIHLVDEPLRFSLKLSPKAEAMVSKGVVRGPRRNAVAEELALAANVVSSLINVATQQKGSGTEILKKLIEVEALRQMSLLAGDVSKSHNCEEVISGTAAIAALGAMGNKAMHVDLLCTLLKRAANMGEDELLLRIASAPRMITFLESLLDQEAKHRITSAEAAGRGDQNAYEVASDSIRRCKEGIASGLSFIVLSRDDAKSLAVKIISKISDSAVAALAVDMAMRNGVSKRVSAQLWLSSLKTVYETDSRHFLPAAPRVFNSASMRESLVAHAVSPTNLTSKSKTDFVFRYRMVSMFVCLSIEDGVDEACAWARECKVRQYPETTANSEKAIVSILAQLACASLRTDALTASRVEKRVSLLRGILELGADVSVANASINLRKHLPKVCVSDGAEVCVAAVAALRDELASLARSSRKCKDKLRSVPRLTLAADILRDLINEVIHVFHLKLDQLPPPKATENPANVIGQRATPKAKKRRQSIPPAKAPITTPAKQRKFIGNFTPHLAEDSTTKSIESNPTTSKEVIFVRFKQ